jgi:hypothetical protein
MSRPKDAPKHLNRGVEGLAELRDRVLDLKTENDVVLDTEGHSELVEHTCKAITHTKRSGSTLRGTIYNPDTKVRTLLNDKGMLLGVLDVLFSGHLKNDVLVRAVLEDNVELVNDNTARVILGGNIVGVNT